MLLGRVEIPDRSPSTFLRAFWRRASIEMSRKESDEDLTRLRLGYLLGGFMGWPPLTRMVVPPPPKRSPEEADRRGGGLVANPNLGTRHGGRKSDSAAHPANSDRYVRTRESDLRAATFLITSTSVRLTADRPFTYSGHSCLEINGHVEDMTVDFGARAFCSKPGHLGQTHTKKQVT